MGAQRNPRQRGIGISHFPCCRFPSQTEYRSSKAWCIGRSAVAGKGSRRGDTCPLVTGKNSNSQGAPGEREEIKKAVIAQIKQESR
ncbi:hypothetical protein SAMN06264849_11533 [Melghirimyces algeriensis]|uniref:Uncharacterized protein n=1 Tax=Melghirimyces algeriensis TaxID=910412 RepID=A0A521FA57_9BACL|nr:hypothetical protein SAMN06264849_11533 [Melghirimyces algeriensis]